MDSLQTFQDFLTTQSVQVRVWSFFLNLLLAAALSFLLGQFFVKYGNVLSNRRMFAQNFVLVTMTTMLIISIVKSSLALSLGLVGALSIVRFRTAIKDPEELSYLFLSIAIGLGFGADQRIITLAAFIVIMGIMYIKHSHSKFVENQNLYLTISADNSHEFTLKQIIEILVNTCSAVNMKRYDENKDLLEVSFLVEFNNLNELDNMKSELQRLNKSISIKFLDMNGINNAY